jgi:hypothetical protein
MTTTRPGWFRTKSCSPSVLSCAAARWAWCEAAASATTTLKVASASTPSARAMFRTFRGDRPAGPRSSAR